jgi:hypothetical protein
MEQELLVVLGDQDTERVRPLLNRLGESLLLEEFIKLLLELPANEPEGEVSGHGRHNSS